MAGTYIRTKEHRDKMRIAVAPTRNLPRTSAQIEHTAEMSKMPKTEEQLRLRRENASRVGKKFGAKNIKAAHVLPKTLAQIKSIRKVGASITPYTIVEHHNDLQHGAKDPDDITVMFFGEHIKLHSKIRIENGTHHLLSQNRQKGIK